MRYKRDVPRYVLFDRKTTDRATGKFWEITLKGNVVSTRTGKVGPLESRYDGKSRPYNDAGRTKNREHANADAARRTYDSLIEAKRAEGYELVDGVEHANPVATVVHRNETIEATLLRAPDDIATYLAYADWLDERGDPRAELIRAQHAMQAGADTTAFLALKKRVDELRRAHDHVWLGQVVADSSYRVRLDWRRGFVDGARIDAAEHASEPSLADLVRALSESPTGCLLRKLTLRHPRGDFADVLPALPPKSLRRLSLLTEGNIDVIETSLAPHRAWFADANVIVEVARYNF